MSPTKKLISAMANLATMALPVSAIAAGHHHNWNQNFGACPTPKISYQGLDRY